MLLGIGSVLIAASLIAAAWLPEETAAQLTIGQTALDVELARTPAEQARGLSGRWCGLSDQRGMVFVYDRASQPTFWMKDMRWPIDLIWLADGRVIGWETNLPPDGGHVQYQAPAPVNQVLEVRAGWVKRHQLALGTPVELMLE